MRLIHFIFQSVQLSFTKANLKWTINSKQKSWAKNIVQSLVRQSGGSKGKSLAIPSIVYIMEHQLIILMLVWSYHMTAWLNKVLNNLISHPFLMRTPAVRRGYCRRRLALMRRRHHNFTCPLPLILLHISSSDQHGKWRINTQFLWLVWIAFTLFNLTRVWVVSSQWSQTSSNEPEPKPRVKLYHTNQGWCACNLGKKE